MKNSIKIKKPIMVKRQINTKYYTSEELNNLKSFFYKNINYRRRVWNDFVEESLKYDKYTDFKPLKYKVEYFKEETNKEIYKDYCVGISEQVAKDMNNSIKTMKTKDKKNFTHSKFRFKSFNPYYGSFKVHCKGYIRDHVDIPDSFNSRVNIISHDIIDFRQRGYEERMVFKLNEPICDELSTQDMFYNKHGLLYNICGKQRYYFNNEDIKEITFLHENGKFYIILTIEVTYVREFNHKHTLCGIDLGIHNPISMYYLGNKKYKNKVISMSNKQIRRIAYLERRAKRLQHIMDYKYSINKKRVKQGELNSIYTKNYLKIQLLFRKTWKHITNIRKHWRNTICKEITNKFSIIVVDSFTTVSKEESISYGLKGKRLRSVNHYNRMHAMYLFNECLIHHCIKNGCLYVEAPKKTTRTCSNCGHENPKLPLTQRIFTCEKCGNILDRDENATKNCFNYGLSII